MAAKETLRCSQKKSNCKKVVPLLHQVAPSRDILSKWCFSSLGRVIPWNVFGLHILLQCFLEVFLANVRCSYSVRFMFAVFCFRFRVIHGFVASSVVCDLLEGIVCLESRFSTSKEIVMRMYSKVPASSGSEESQQGFRCRLGLRAVLAGQTLPKNVQAQKAQKAAPEATPNETSHAVSSLLPITPVHVE